MSKSTVKVVEIDTNPAVKSIKDLRKEIIELKNQMANLDEDSDAFGKLANQAGDLKHQLDEINQRVRGSSSDFGDMVGNVANLTAGLVGAFSAVQGGLQAMGVESEAVDETIKRMQGLIAVVQGLSSIDGAIDSMNDLRNSIKSTTAAAKLLKAALQPKVFLAITAVIAGLTFAFNKLKGKVDEVKTAQEEYNKKLKEERELNTNNQIDARLRYLNKELRIKEAIASVKYGDDELKYKQEMLRAYTTELERAEANIRNVENFDPGEAYYNKLGIDRATFIEGLKKERDELKKLREQTEDDIAVITAKNAELAKLPKKHDGTAEEAAKERKKNYEDEVKVIEYLIELYKELYGEDSVAFKEEELNLAERSLANIKSYFGETSEEYKNQLLIVLDLRKAFEELTAVKEETLSNEEIELALENDRLKEMAKGWLYNEETAIETFDRISEELKLALDRDLITQQQYDTAVKNLAKERTRYIVEQSVKTFSAASDFVTTLLDGIADQQDTNNKEGFEKSKKLQIASATIGLLTGITNAISGLFTTKSGPWDIALAAIQAATIAASGAVQINKIKNTKFDSGGSTASVNSSAVSAMVMPPVQYSNTVLGSETKGAIANQRIYVLESDISKTTKAVVTQTEENIY